MKKAMLWRVKAISARLLLHLMVVDPIAQATGVEKVSNEELGPRAPPLVRAHNAAHEG
ncbi:hypothetical protein [Clavibacter michiganensis]|uniref:hypothetical protein n=1 Tax=Clavibacter michiganensis TaxID=28447 RepID=UPI0015E2F241|nr:hypothetical protein [Clavibacter michiganensis]